MNSNITRQYARTVLIVRSASCQRKIARVPREEAEAKVAAGSHAPLGAQCHKPITRIVPVIAAVERPSDTKRGRARILNRLDMPKPTTTESESDDNPAGTIKHMPMHVNEYAIFRAPRFGRARV